MDVLTKALSSRYSLDADTSARLLMLARYGAPVRAATIDRLKQLCGYGQHARRAGTGNARQAMPAPGGGMFGGGVFGALLGGAAAALGGAIQAVAAAPAPSPWGPHRPFIQQLLLEAAWAKRRALLLRRRRLRDEWDAKDAADAAALAADATSAGSAGGLL
jgi:hypothetical protein